MDLVSISYLFSQAFVLICRSGSFVCLELILIANLSCHSTQPHLTLWAPPHPPMLHHTTTCATLLHPYASLSMLCRRNAYVVLYVVLYRVCYCIHLYFTASKIIIHQCASLNSMHDSSQCTSIVDPSHALHSALPTCTTILFTHLPCDIQWDRQLIWNIEKSWNKWYKTNIILYSLDVARSASFSGGFISLVSRLLCIENYTGKFYLYLHETYFIS